MQALSQRYLNHLSLGLYRFNIKDNPPRFQKGDYVFEGTKHEGAVEFSVPNPIIRARVDRYLRSNPSFAFLCADDGQSPKILDAKTL